MPLIKQFHLPARVLGLVFLVGMNPLAQAKDEKDPYPSMAAVAQYHMPNRDEEIALARSAAPASISNDAEILVLGDRGYETAVKGKNGFVCLVERAWLASLDD